ncbi:flavodoxin [Arsukibacterium sp. MJ3]|jgi:MioC protein|uniref:flavodoxin n=1 Tax=Arsukibacterium sp. MJ3 TaxID=1632859 RepID=UPI000626EEFA|nr:flavodoxin [Arsukibacterium sp. MJ3]KKO50119.1 flavodoxin [Arsukibacterium sp. MJ3]
MTKIALIVGSVYGGAQYVAEQAEPLLASLGYEVALYEEANLDTVLGFEPDIWLVISSTTGQGDIPDNVFPFFSEVKNRFPLLTGKRFAVIALGDSSYETFCSAGEQFRELLLDIQGLELAPMLRIDASETLEPETIALPWLTEQFKTR